MSITSDIRSYADNAIEQGKQVLDSRIASAQAQLNDVTGQANEFVGKLTEKANVSGLTSKATDAVNDLRSQAEKAINLDAIKSAIEPYLARGKGYTASVTDRAESLFSSVKDDKRVAKLVDAAESFTGTVVETVQDRVVKPVQSFTGLRSTASKPAAKPVVKAAATKPAPAKATPAKAAAKPATKPAARKSPVRKATKA